MSVREVIIQLRSPVCLSDRPALGNEVLSSSYISGSALRGMLATRYINSIGSAESAEFKKIFGPGGVCFSNLYLEDSHPLPFSAFTCKRHPGFLKDNTKDNPSHGVIDLFFATDKYCRECKHTLVEFDRRFYKGQIHDLRSQETPSTLRMRTSVLESGAPREGALFVQTEIPAGKSFQGSIASVDESAAELVEKFNGNTEGYLGRRRSGKARIDLRRIEIPRETPQLYEWSGAGKRWAAMTFTSDVIMLDRLLRPITNLNDKNISEYFALPNGVKVVVTNAFVQCRKVAGWSGIGQMFKPDDIAMRAGSTFLLYFEIGEENAILNWMKDIVEHGIGLRCEEGFGRVTFSEPLHLATLKNQKAGQAL